MCHVPRGIYIYIISISLRPAPLRTYDRARGAAGVCWVSVTDCSTLKLKLKPRPSRRVLDSQLRTRKSSARCFSRQGARRQHRRAVVRVSGVGVGVGVGVGRSRREGLRACLLLPRVHSSRIPPPCHQWVVDARARGGQWAQPGPRDSRRA
jgi:hypothetical protein